MRSNRVSVAEYTSPYHPHLSDRGSRYAGSRSLAARRHPCAIHAQVYLFASNVFVSIFGLLFLYLAIDGGVDNTGHLGAFSFPLLAVIHFGLRKGTIAIGLFIAIIIFFFVADFPLAASQYYLDFNLRFVSSFLTIIIFAYLHEYIRPLFSKK